MANKFLKSQADAAWEAFKVASAYADAVRMGLVFALREYRDAEVAELDRTRRSVPCLIEAGDRLDQAEMDFESAQAELEAAQDALIDADMEVLLEESERDFFGGAWFAPRWAA